MHERYQQGIGRLELPHIRPFFSGVVVARLARQEVRRDERPFVFVCFEDRVAFRQHAGARIHLSGGAAAVDHFHLRKAAAVHADVDEAARRNERARDTVRKEYIRIVEPEDLHHVEIVVFEVAENEPVRHGVHALRAPTEAGRQRRQSRHIRRRDLQVEHAVLHFVVTIAQLNPRLLRRQFQLKLFQTQSATSFLNISARYFRSAACDPPSRPLGGGMPLCAVGLPVHALRKHSIAQCVCVLLLLFALKQLV